jgi:two-component system C4-dicarboxylate transport response regulator DctD
VRIIAASTADLRQAAAQGRFLSALLYRLNGVVLRLPPLRERREDIPLLFDHFLRDAARRFRRDAPAIAPDHRAMLAEHDWPGNVRELIHYAERVVLGVEESTFRQQADDLSLADRVSRFEAAQLRQALLDHGGRVGAAIEALKLPRKTFYDKLKRHGIDPAAWRSR